MCAFRLFLSVDSSLGRLDYSLLPDQALMEMLIEGFDDDTKKRYQDKHGMYLDVCEWSCVRCDEDESVIAIDIDSRHVRGSLELCYVPPKVKMLHISSHFEGQLTGSVDLRQLPDGMKKFSLQGNKLSGEINLPKLPKGMKQLVLNRNKLTGGIDLTLLPDGMYNLSLKNNQLTGEIDLTHLPDRIRWLELNNNYLTGEIDLRQLPKGMRQLDLQNNQLTGSLVIKKLPRMMNLIDVRGNHFNAIAVIDSKTRASIKLDMSGVTSVVAENGKERNMKLFLE